MADFADQQSDIIHLEWGWPSMSLAPIEAIRTSCNEALGACAAGELEEMPFAPADVLHYGDFAGAEVFRVELARFLSDLYRRPVHRQNLFATAGAGAALDMVCTVFTKPGDTVLVEAATYHNAFKIFADHHLRVQTVPDTDEGSLDLDALSAQLSDPTGGVSLIYLIPTFCNPTGRTLTDDTRRKIVEVAAAHDVRIVADEVYHQLQFADRSPPPPLLCDYDPTGSVVLALGSFTKIAAPGLRLGWIQTGGPASSESSPEATSSLLARLATHGVVRNGGSLNHFASMVMTSMMATGRLQTHVERLRKVYGNRARILSEALKSGIPESVATFTPPHGGYYIWLQLNADIHTDVHSLLTRARDLGVSFRDGAKFSLSPPTSSHNLSSCLRLCFAYYEEADLQRAASALTRALIGP